MSLSCTQALKDPSIRRNGGVRAATTFRVASPLSQFLASELPLSESKVTTFPNTNFLSHSFPSRHVRQSWVVGRARLAAAGPLTRPSRLKGSRTVSRNLPSHGSPRMRRFTECLT
jgi:hypothetical protein